MFPCENIPQLSTKFVFVCINFTGHNH